MDNEKALETATALLAPFAQSTARPDPLRLDAMLAVDQLLPAVKALMDNKWGYLVAISGVDLGPATGQLEVLYHFGGADNGITTSLRVRIPRANATVPSVCGPVPSASLYERELSEMLGITVVDTPNPEHLFLPDGWPDGLYPLRKDAPVPTATSLKS